jgi:hypothetical protein
MKPRAGLALFLKWMIYSLLEQNEQKIIIPCWITCAVSGGGHVTGVFLGIYITDLDNSSYVVQYIQVDTTQAETTEICTSLYKND